MSGAPTLTAHLLPKVDARLIELLASLTAAEWDLPTIAPRWTVRDVAAHLLDTQLRKLSVVRDGHVTETPEIHSPGDLVRFINRLNAEGVAVYRRLSPRLLIAWTEIAARESAVFHQSLDPFAPAAFAVSWAGDEASPNWFDTGRELTERWHHQQQIRLATNRPDIMTPELYHPVLDCFLRALPHTYREVIAPQSTGVQVDVAGDCGGTWFLLRDDGAWRLVDELPGTAATRLTIPQEIAWRIFTKGIDRAAAAAQVTVEGDAALAQPVLGMTAIVG